MEIIKNQKSEHVQVPLTISPETQAIIECMDSLNKHWEQTSTALRKMYFDTEVCEMMDKEYSQAFDELKNALQWFLVQSIEHHMGKNNFKEI